MPVLVKVNENNLKYELKLLEIEPVSLGRIKNVYGVNLSFEVIIRLLNPDTLEEIESHSLNISESVINGGYGELSKLIAEKFKKKSFLGVLKI